MLRNSGASIPDCPFASKQTKTRGPRDLSYNLQDKLRNEYANTQAAFPSPNIGQLKKIQTRDVLPVEKQSVHPAAPEELSFIKPRSRPNPVTIYTKISDPKPHNQMMPAVFGGILFCERCRPAANDGPDRTTSTCTLRTLIPGIFSMCWVTKWRCLYYREHLYLFIVAP
jgi:hypothetical protein